MATSNNRLLSHIPPPLHVLRKIIACNIHLIMYRIFCLLVLLVLPTLVSAQSRQTQNVFLITLDGLRWEELYTGADAALIRDENYVRDTTALMHAFWADNPETQVHLDRGTRPG